MTRRIAFADAPTLAQADFNEYRTQCDLFGVQRGTWGAWWARYGADYLPSGVDHACGEDAAEGPNTSGDSGQGPSAVQSVPGRAPGSAMKRAPEHHAALPARPAGQRSLRNDIARQLLDGDSDRWGLLRVGRLRRHLEDAQLTLDACANWVLVFGPQSLIDEVAR